MEKKNTEKETYSLFTILVVCTVSGRLGFAA